MDWALGAVIVATSVSAAIVALLSLSANSPRKPAISADPPPADPPIFLFDEETLIDATASGYSLLRASQMPGSDWEKLSHHLAARFPSLTEKMAGLADAGRLTLRADGDAPMQIEAEYISGMVRIVLSDLDAEGSGVIVDALSQRAQIEEIEILRQTVAADPALIWRTSAADEVVWANRAYLDRAACHLGIETASLAWPLPRLLDCGGDPGTRRVRMTGNAPFWYDCHTVPAGSERLHFAVPADALVRAETAMREFVQTLTKTFAHLPIGLAIFDRQRQLALFNPALGDLTTLGPDFLLARPSLFAFLDRLRDARMMPEPKDYHAWRQQMAELERAASSGLYEEIWSLPGGQTYRVTGRPHPEGAVALLFEDISAETALGRRFRSEIDQSHEILDGLDEAICVFSAAGTVVTTNAAHVALWGGGAAQTLGGTSVVDILRLWIDRSEPSPVWSDIRDFVLDMGDRAGWSDGARLRDGRQVTCRIVPLSGGATMVAFAVAAARDRAPRKIRRMRRRPLLSALVD